MAWPDILAISQLVELNWAAVINKFFGTSEEIIALKLGPENALIAPVIKIML